MGFLKDFKEDFSQAVNELMPSEDNLEDSKLKNDVEVNTLEGGVDVAAELSKIDELLEKVAGQMETKIEKKDGVKNTAPERKVTVPEQKATVPEQKTTVPEQKVTVPGQKVTVPEQKVAVPEQKAAEPKKIDEKAAEPKKADEKAEKNDKFVKPYTYERKEKPEKTETAKTAEKDMKEPKVQEVKKMVEKTTPVRKELPPATDEVSVITKGMIIKGDILTNGSLDIQGEVYGNVDCSGKLVITGTVRGDSNASEIFADAARIEGEVASTGTVKIGIGSIIIGNVSSSSAVVAGAIKGDIDVQGPVVVDTSAVVKGNIKSRSVQINNGAVIDGFCSQVYADIDMDSLFSFKEGK